MARVGPALLLLLVLGCDHAEPFAVSDPAVDGPFAPGAVVRLTFGPGISPATWVPSGDTLVMAARDQDRGEGDVCLFLLPARGGTRRRLACSTGHAQSDSIEIFAAPSVSASAMLAFTYFHRRVAGSTFGSIRSSLLDAPHEASELTSLPFSAGGRLFQKATDLGWQDDGSLTFVGWTDEVLERTCNGIPCDELLRIPYGVFRAVPGAGVTAVPGTHLVTSATPDGNGGLLATFPGNDHLWRISPAGDSVAVHDFGNASGVRDADFRAGKVAVIVGGNWTDAVDDIGLMRTDAGYGDLVVVDLASGTVTRVGPADMLFRDPALSPDGRSVVATGTQFTTIPLGMGLFDTVMTRPDGDLWRIDLP